MGIYSYVQQLAVPWFLCLKKQNKTVKYMLI